MTLRVAIVAVDPVRRLGLATLVTRAGHQVLESHEGADVVLADDVAVGLPYLDGFTGIYADKQAVRVEAIRGDRAG